MRWQIGMRVRVTGTDIKGRITDIRIGYVASDDITDGSHCEYNPKTKLPDYIEIDNDVQVHPSRVRRV